MASIRSFLIDRGHDAAEIDKHEPETVGYFSIAEKAGNTFTACSVCGPERGSEDAYPCKHLLELAAQYADHPGYDPAWSAEGQGAAPSVGRPRIGSSTLQSTPAAAEPEVSTAEHRAADIVEFLHARYDEEADPLTFLLSCDADEVVYDGGWDHWGEYGEALERVVKPRRMLADIVAKRAMIDAIFDYEAETDDICFHTAESIRAYECPVKPVGDIEALRILAAPYAEHPDYDPAWRVDA